MGAFPASPLTLLERVRQAHRGQGFEYRQLSSPALHCDYVAKRGKPRTSSDAKT